MLSSEIKQIHPKKWGIGFQIILFLYGNQTKKVNEPINKKY